MNIEKQIALVTGGASGMGAACVAWLRARGAQVMVWDRQIIEGDGLMCDVSSSEGVEQALNTTIKTMGVPRICIQCAGVAPAARMVGKNGPMLLSAFKEVVDINLVGTFNVMRVVADALSREACADDAGGRGVIINTASIAAYEGQIGQLAYSASKGGVVSMTLPAARELAQFGIRVNTIAPGLIATPMLLNMPADVQERLAATVPFPHRFGKPQEFAALVGHVIENEMINGEVIRLDGALRMQAK